MADPTGRSALARPRPRPRTASAITAGLLVALLLAACGHGRSAASGDTGQLAQQSTSDTDSPASPTPSDTTEPSPGGQSDSPGPSASAGNPSPCGLADVDVALTDGGAASGHRSMVIRFTNRSQRPCTMHGYPAVAALDSYDAEVAEAKPTVSGYLGGLPSGRPLPTVTIAPGASASALVEASAANQGDGSTCTAYAGLLVTLPDDNRAAKVDWSGDGCSNLQIHPVVAGSTGQG